MPRPRTSQTTSCASWSINLSRQTRACSDAGTLGFAQTVKFNCFPGSQRPVATTTSDRDLIEQADGLLLALNFNEKHPSIRHGPGDRRDHSRRDPNQTRSESDTQNQAANCDEQGRQSNNP